MSFSSLGKSESAMAFRRRNIVVAQSKPGAPIQAAPAVKQILAPGIRPSPLDGRLTTSTGTRSLDSLLAGHAGLALGTSLLIEESGTTDFAGSLLRYYAAEGVTQGHTVHVLGAHEPWGRELPGLGSGEGKEKEERKGEDKMKIAWRYERLGEFGAGARGGCSYFVIYVYGSEGMYLCERQIGIRYKRLQVLLQLLFSAMILI